MISDPNSNIFTKSMSQLWHTASQLWHHVTIVTRLEILVLTIPGRSDELGQMSHLLFLIEAFPNWRYVALLYPRILVPRFSWPVVDVSSGQGWYEWLIMHWLLIGVSQVPAEASLSPEESRPAPATRILVREGGHWRRITGDPPFLPTCGNFVQMVLHFFGKCRLFNR